MAFVERGWRSFLRTGDPDPTAWRGRMAGQLMTYEACTDPRAWCLSVADRRQHLIDIMRRGPEDLDSTLLPAAARREQVVVKTPSEVKVPPPPITPTDVGVNRVDFTEEETPTVTDEVEPTITEEKGPTAEESIEETKTEKKTDRRTMKDRTGNFCEGLSELANELDDMLKKKSVCSNAPRIFEICSELSKLATECHVMQSQMEDRQSQAYVLVEAVRATADSDLQEELIEDYDHFDSTRFQIDIAQVRILEEKLNAMRIESIEDDAEETDETWELRNIVAQLENKLEYSQDDQRLPGHAEDYSQTDYLSVTLESEVTEPSEGSVSSHEESGYHSTIPDKRSQDGKEVEELRSYIESLQRRIEVLESERQEYRGRDVFDESRDSAILKEQLDNLSLECDNLVAQLNNARIEAENLQQEKSSLLLEAEQTRQQLAQLQGEHLAALDYIKSLEESTAECTMVKEENKRCEEKLKQSSREQGKLHHEVHRLQCIIKDVEDDRKRTLNQLDRLSLAAEWAKVLQKVH